MGCVAQWRQRLSTTSDWSRQGVVAGLACVGYKALVHENKEAASLQVSSSSPCPGGAGSVVQLCPGCVTHWGQCHGVRSSALTRITGLGTKGYKIAPKRPIGLRLGDAAPRLPFWGRRLPPGLLWLLGSSCSSSSGCPRAIGHFLHHLSCDSALGPPGQVLPGSSRPSQSQMNHLLEDIFLFLCYPSWLIPGTTQLETEKTS